VNPYGYHLHEHIFFYLQSDFILKHVQEFQSPDFRGEAIRMYEVALLLSLALIWRLLQQRRVVPSLMLLAWAHASLLSVRHMPLFMIVAVPLLAVELSRLIEDGAKAGNPWLQGLKNLADDYGGGNRTASERGYFALGWLSLAGVAVVALMLHWRGEERPWKAEFAAIRFPARACNALGDRFPRRRVLTMDQWADYLIYRYYPEVKVFIDGRSDFYAPQVRDDYVALLGAEWRWEKILDRYEFDSALIPVDWPLAAALKLDTRWELLYDDGFALYFERKRPAIVGQARAYESALPQFARF
jgi:hypothetical protein